MFEFITDTIKTAGRMTGSILAVPVFVVAETLKIPVVLVKEAIASGCETYEEIKDFLGK